MNIIPFFHRCCCGCALCLMDNINFDLEIKKSKHKSESYHANMIALSVAGDLFPGSAHENLLFTYFHHLIVSTVFFLPKLS